MVGQCEFEDLRKLRQRWLEARRQKSTPRYEDVAIGHLGELATEMVVLRCDGKLSILRCGNAIAAQIGLPLPAKTLTGISLNYLDAISQGVIRAQETLQPSDKLIPCVSNGNAGICEFLFLPLDWKGETLVVVWCRQRRTSQNLLDAIYRSTNDGMLIVARISQFDSTHDYQIMSCNASACRFLGASEGEIQWRMLSSFLPREQYSDVIENLADIKKSGDSVSFELGHKSSKGVRRHLKMSAVGIGELISVSLSDITTIKEREDSVRVLFESNPIPNIVYDLHSFQIISVNEAAIHHYGYTREQFQNLTFMQLCDGDAHRQYLRESNSVQDGSNKYLHLKHHTAEGRLLDVMCYTRRIWLNGLSRMLASIIDITEQREAEAKIIHMAHHDHLTSLANRVLLRTTLESALVEVSSSKRNIAVLCIDLDDFKRVNDTLGHPAGDFVLASVASRLRKLAGDRNLVARLGGDEFAVVQFDVDARGEAEVLGTLIIEQLSLPYYFEGQEIAIGASLGISLTPYDGLEADLLLKSADIAMYRAKVEGKARLRFFEAEMDERLQARRAMEVDLRTAVLRDQFELYFQPLFEISRAEIIGCEALIRWHHPDKGMIPPAEFIPIAEETGLISQIGDWVLLEACKEAMHWPSNLKVAVNLSPIQFRGRTLFDSVLSALSKSGLPACRLELEITESVLFADSDANRETLARLRQLGISISMDDFGTGYSSLSYLRSFAFDKIKIDRSFISDIGSNPDCLAIVRSVAMLGQSLGIPTLAEGVETIEQLEQLRKEGCHQVQGYYFSPPKPAAAIRELVNPTRVRNVA